jgi:hypothetical protein
MNPTETAQKDTNPLTGRTRTGGTYDTATRSALVPSNRVDTSGSTVVSPESLQTPTPIKVPPAPVSTATAGMQGALESAQTQTDTYLQDLTKATETAQIGKNSALEQYLGTLMAPGEVARTAEAYAQKGGVDDIQKELDVINNKILTEQNSLRRRINTLQRMGGGLASGAQSEIENLERESLSKQADLYVIQMGVQGRFDSAKAIADRAVSAQLEVQQQKQNVLGLIYQENKEMFTKAEQREFETKQADRERKIQEEADNKKSMYELAIQAQMDGAPTSVVEQMLASKTKEEALAIGGSYIGALDREAKRASISNIYSQISERNRKTEDPVQLAKAEARRQQQAVAGEAVIGKVSEALSMVNRLSTGFIGGTTVKVPGTPAYNLDKTVETIKANLGFDRLQQMRENSPTGGALGQVAVQELVALQSVVANMETGQSQDQLTRNLQLVDKHYKTWLGTLGFIVAPDGQVVEITD